MSGIILDCYWHYLNNKSLTIDEKIIFYIRYWKIREEPDDIPCENGNVIFVLTHTENELERYLYIVKCVKEKKYLVYEYEKGWSDPTEQVLDRINELVEEEGVISAPLVRVDSKADSP